MIEHAEKLGMIVRESHPFGDVLGHDADSAVLMTWYRNNASHAFALPSLIACLLVNRRRRIRRTQLLQMVDDRISVPAERVVSRDYRQISTSRSATGSTISKRRVLIHRSDDEVGPPPVESDESYRLRCWRRS